MNQNVSIRNIPAFVQVGLFNKFIPYQVKIKKQKPKKWLKTHLCNLANQTILILSGLKSFMAALSS